MVKYLMGLFMALTLWASPQKAHAGVPVIDLRLVCTEAGDYSPMSPIEPSVVGGAKIAGAIVRLVTGHDFATRRCAVWV